MAPLDPITSKSHGPDESQSGTPSTGDLLAEALQQMFERQDSRIEQLKSSMGLLDPGPHSDAAIRLHDEFFRGEGAGVEYEGKSDWALLPPELRELSPSFEVIGIRTDDFKPVARVTIYDPETNTSYVLNPDTLGTRYEPPESGGGSSPGDRKKQALATATRYRDFPQQFRYEKVKGRVSMIIEAARTDRGGYDVQCQIQESSALDELIGHFIRPESLAETATEAPSTEDSNRDTLQSLKRGRGRRSYLQADEDGRSLEDPATVARSWEDYADYTDPTYRERGFSFVLHRVQQALRGSTDSSGLVTGGVLADFGLNIGPDEPVKILNEIKLRPNNTLEVPIEIPAPAESGNVGTVILDVILAADVDPETSLLSFSVKGRSVRE